MRRSVRRKRVLATFESLEARQWLAAQPVISEAQAVNDTTLQDGDGNFSDWIELYNAGDEAVNLAGWHLTVARKAEVGMQIPSGIHVSGVALARGENYQVLLRGKTDLRKLPLW